MLTQQKMGKLQMQSTLQKWDMNRKPEQTSRNRLKSSIKLKEGNSSKFIVWGQHSWQTTDCTTNACAYENVSRASQLKALFSYFTLFICVYVYVQVSKVRRWTLGLLVLELQVFVSHPSEGRRMWAPVLRWSSKQSLPLSHLSSLYIVFCVVFLTTLQLTE